ncbi:RNA-binding S4 domain-containing protein [Arcanobacterium hippocoleae]|uniref:Ribosome-associated protein n=1 Tax=Arcanobacterium hippocoleae TaxID=149017 RepID=A0ABU1T115_9ACTO|nr:RNA-binding S4 domain-containing protein [Arcanobacterium hippocoleae]MDR6938990.1 ribosome-associated protein [Arcanobacterium hippocoleae]
MHQYQLRLPIRLSQFLKLSNLAENGAQAKELIHAQCVLVNGQTQIHPAHQLQDGDEVTIDDGLNKPITLRVVSE